MFEDFSVLSLKYLCTGGADSGFWRGATREHPPRSGALTEEQRSQNPKAAQPAGRHVLLAQTSLFAPYRSLKDMLVAHASSEPKIHCCQYIVISETQH